MAQVETPIQEENAKLKREVNNLKAELKECDEALQECRIAIESVKPLKNALALARGKERKYEQERRDFIKVRYEMRFKIEELTEELKKYEEMKFFKKKIYRYDFNLPQVYQPTGGVVRFNSEFLKKLKKVFRKKHNEFEAIMLTINSVCEHGINNSPFESRADCMLIKNGAHGINFQVKKDDIFFTSFYW